MAQFRFLRVIMLSPAIETGMDGRMASASAVPMGSTDHSIEIDVSNVPRVHSEKRGRGVCYARLAERVQLRKKERANALDARKGQQHMGSESPVAFIDCRIRGVWSKTALSPGIDVARLACQSVKLTLAVSRGFLDSQRHRTS